MANGLDEMSIRRPGIRRVIGSKEPVRDLDYVRLNRELHNGVARYEAARDAVLAQARTGDIGALYILWERWKVRLPKIEEELRFIPSWIRNSSMPCGGMIRDEI